MVEPTEIAPGVHCLEVGKGITRSNVYFVRSGSSWVLIDTVFYESGLSINVMYTVDDPKKRGGRFQPRPACSRCASSFLTDLNPMSR
jgi:hypothetical protein